MYDFQDLIKKIRKQAGLTQKEFAEVLGVSTILIALVETGKKEPSKALIEKLAVKLDVHPSAIMPFVFFEKNTNLKKMSKPEKSLIRVGEQLQNFLIKKKSKRLKFYAE